MHDTHAAQVAMGNAAGEIAVCCRGLPGSRVLHVAPAEPGCVDGAGAFGALAATVRPACMACTTGLAVTAMASVCATFAATAESIEAAGGADVTCWQLHCATARAAGGSTGGGEAPLCCWAQPLEGAPPSVSPLLCMSACGQ